jgi:hypothetical protein
MPSAQNRSNNAEALFTAIQSPAASDEAETIGAAAMMSMARVDLDVRRWPAQLRRATRQA